MEGINQPKWLTNLGVQWPSALVWSSTFDWGHPKTQFYSWLSYALFYFHWWLISSPETTCFFFFRFREVARILLKYQIKIHGFNPDWKAWVATPGPVIMSVDWHEPGFYTITETLIAKEMGLCWLERPIEFHSL